VPFVYVLRCSDGTFYTGWALDLDARIKAHNAGVGARYTRSRLPVTLHYAETAPTRSTALQREAAIRRLSRAAKDQLSRPVDGPALRR
jgi:putative endonuclease